MIRKKYSYLKRKIDYLKESGWSKGICYGYIMAHEDIKKTNFEDISKLYDYIIEIFPRSEII